MDIQPHTRYFNEMHADDNAVRDIYSRYSHWLAGLADGSLERNAV